MPEAVSQIDAPPDIPVERVVRFLDAPDLDYLVQIRPTQYARGVYCTAAPLFGRDAHKCCLNYWLSTAEGAEAHLLERVEQIVLRLLDARRPDYRIECGVYSNQPIADLSNEYLQYLRRKMSADDERWQAAVAELGRRHTVSHETISG